MVELYMSGLSSNEVGQVLRRSKATVLSVLRRRGVKLRPLYPKGPDNKLWRGRKVDQKGYVMVWIADDDPMCSMAYRTGYVPEHRLVMARQLGRPLTTAEHVHHINGVKGDNRRANLQLVTVGHPTGVRYCCRDCGSLRLRPVALEQRA